MKFLDLNGLTHFFGKVKTWTGDNYLSLGGGLIRGNVTFYPNDPDPSRRIDIEEGEIIIKDTDINRYININDSTITSSDYDDTYLFGSGKMIPIGSANGVAGLDSNGYVPLSQLGNLDTTVAEVVTALPTTNIKKHIYLVKDASGVTQNQYEEYLYTGDTSAEYDASKWEKLGDFRPTVDFANYAKKTDTVKNISFTTYGATNTKILRIVKADDTIDNVSIPITSINGYGFMDESDKRKLDGIANNANNYSLPTASSTTKGGITLGYSQSGKNYPVALDNNGKAYVNVSWTDTTYDLSPYAKKNEAVNKATALLNQNSIYITFKTITEKVLGGFELFGATSESSGVMSAADKTKLDGIATGATVDSAITTAEIDALFA